MILLHRAMYPDRQQAALAVLDGLGTWATFGQIAITYSDVGGGAVLVVVERREPRPVVDSPDPPCAA